LADGTSSLQLLTDPPRELRSAIGVYAAAFRHGLDAHWCEDDVLGPLVAAVPRSWVRADLAQYSPHEPRGREPLGPDADLEGLVRNLATAAVTIRIYNLEYTSAFRELAHACGGPVEDLVGDRERGVAAINLAAIVASPGAVTPAHPDRHHNLLFAVAGKKEVWVEDDPQPRRHHVRVVDYFRYPQKGIAELPPARLFILEPGDGIYIPPYTFHWTRVVDGPAMGISIGFSTPATKRAGVIQECDLRLRRLGLRPHPVDPFGQHAAIKARLGAAASALGRVRARIAARGRGDTVPSAALAGEEGGHGDSAP
jgi:JmjC domain